MSSSFEDGDNFRLFVSHKCGELSEKAKQFLEIFSLKQSEVENFNSDLTPTPLVKVPKSKELFGLNNLLLKDEGQRLGLKAFKVVGVIFAMHELEKRHKFNENTTIVAVTDGNHGRAVAYMSRQRGYRCKIWVPNNMSPVRMENLRREGAEVIIVEEGYQRAAEDLQKICAEKGYVMVQDMSMTGYPDDVPMDIICGYGQIFREVELQLPQVHIHAGSKPISHIILQAGVGTFASGGMAYSYLNKLVATKQHIWSPHLKIIVLEPTDADCLMENAKLYYSGEDNREIDQQLVECKGNADSMMSGLNCSLPSQLSWPLNRDVADLYCAISDDYVMRGVRAAHALGIVTGECGGGSFGMLLALREYAQKIEDRSIRMMIDGLFADDSVVLCVNTEADTDPEIYQNIINT